MNKKAIVIFDTNRLLQNPDDKRNYSNVDFGGDYAKLVLEILPSFYISDNVDIAIPKMCIDEIKQRKIEDFNSRFSSIEDRYKKIKDDSEIISNLIEKDFGDLTKNEVANQTLVDAVDLFVATQKIKIIDFPGDENFKPIIERALRRKTPFLKTTNDGSDKGFKDVVIWHSILQCEDLSEYDFHILFSQDAGFDLNCLDEFEKKYQKKMIRIEELQALKTQLLKLYPEEERSKIEVKSRVIQQYFQEQLYLSIKNILEENKNIKDFQIIEQYVDSEIIEEGYGLTVKINIDFVDAYPSKEGVVKVSLNDIFEIQEVDEDSLIEIFDTNPEDADDQN